MTARAAACALALTLAACGDAAVDSAFEGAPVDELTCRVVFATGAAPLGSRPHAALAWQTDDGRIVTPDSDRNQFLLHPADGLRVDEAFPGEVHLRLLDPPPAAVELAWPDVDGRLALGQVVVFDDRDGDGGYGRGERLMGIGQDLVVVFSRAGASGAAIGVVAPGFHHRASAPCDGGPRFADGDAHACTLVIDSAPQRLLRFDCGPDYPCEGLTELRFLCRWDPDDERCATCAGAVFPPEATPADCDAWLPGCLATYPPDECRAEWRTCSDGEPPCDRSCLCQHRVGECMQLGDEAQCRMKYDCPAP
ncbi:MAG: hypothetical protein U1F43_35245 [Myxococcota bacterium]